MSVCPSCHHENIEGAVFCSECGTVLITGDTIATRNIKGGKDTAEVVDVPAEQIKGWVTLHILPSGQLLPLAEKTEFTLGRLSDNQPIVPDVDLGPYQAYSLGVSRLHAVIKKLPDGRVQIMDMGSSNGTYLNGRRLEPREPASVSHGDVVALGKLKMQILIA